MVTLLKNSESSKPSDPNRVILDYVALLNLSICNTWENIKKSYKNNKLKY